MYLSDVQSHNDLFQGGVTSTLADPVDRALHLSHAPGSRPQNRKKTAGEGKKRITEETKKHVLIYTWYAFAVILQYGKNTHF